MNKRFLIAVLTFICLFPTVVHAEITIPKDALDIQIPASDNVFTDSLDFYAIASALANAEFKIEPSTLIEKITSALFGELKTGMGIFFTVLSLAMLCAIVSAMQTSFGKDGVNDLVFFICYALAAVACIKALQDAMTLTSRTVSDVYTLTAKVSPVLMGFAFAAGHVSAAALFKPVLYSCVYIMQYILKYFIMPGIGFAAAISIVSNLNTSPSLTNLSNTAGGIIKSVLGTSAALFVAISSIYGFVAPSIDAITAKTAKLAANTFIPVVGGAMGDAIELAGASAKLIKNSVGASLIVIIIVMSAYPLLKLAALLIIFRFAAALTEPITDKRFTSLINSVADTLQLTVAAVTLSSLIVIVVTAIVIAATQGG